MASVVAIVRAAQRGLSAAASDTPWLEATEGPAVSTSVYAAPWTPAMAASP